MSLRDQRRLQHQELSRAQILDAAEEVFALKGFHDATIKEIASLAEFSVGAVYSFFENKDDLFVQICLRRGGEFMEGMREVMAAPGRPLEQLHRLVDYEVRFFREHSNFGRLWLRSHGVRLGALESKIDQAVAENYAEAMALQTKLFREGQAQGELREGEPEVLGLLFSGLMMAFQGSDPVVTNGAASGTERMSLDELHDIVDAAFRSPA